MKKIGLLGGMSWESSLEYYRLINEMVKESLGESHSANCLMYSFDFHEVEVLQHKGEWDKLTELMVKEAMNLKSAGAECIVICTNTMHRMAPDIEDATHLPLIHIADVTAAEILKHKIYKVLLLGTKFTMSGNFYRERLEAQGIETIVPEVEEQQVVHEIIYNELILGKINPDSRQKYIDLINKYGEVGAKGVVLGCTEIPLLIQQADVDVTVFDTTHIHSKAVVEFSINA